MYWTPVTNGRGDPSLVDSDEDSERRPLLRDEMNGNDIIEEEDPSRRIRGGGIHSDSDDAEASSFGRPGLRRQTSATVVRQSRPFVLFNLLILCVLTLMVVWVVVTPGHFPTDPVFVVLEIVVTTVVTAEVALEIAHYGCWTYFFPKRLPKGSPASVQCSRIALHFWNWFQFILAILCVMTLVLFLRDTRRRNESQEVSEEEIEEVEFDEALILAGLVGRYMFYVVFVCSLQWRVTRSQGGWDCNEFFDALKRCAMCDFTLAPPLKEQWDILMEENAPIIDREGLLKKT